MCPLSAAHPVVCTAHGTGEVALPGGKQDDEDIDDIHTALREAHEEASNLLFGSTCQQQQYSGDRPHATASHSWLHPGSSRVCLVALTACVPDCSGAL